MSGHSSNTTVFSSSEIEFLINLPLPVLQAKIQDAFPMQGSLTFAPCIYLPLGELLEHHRIRQAKVLARQQLELLERRGTFHDRYFLIIDRWSGIFEFELLLELVATVCSDQSQFFDLSPLPISCESLRLIQKKHFRNSPDLTEIFQQLSQYQCSTVRGDDLELLHSAHENGFFLWIEANQPLAASFESPAGISILEYLEWMKQHPRISLWSPLWFRCNSNIQDNEISLRFLKDICCIRLLFPSEINIGVQPSICGLEFGILATNFGANHLGFFAADRQTAKITGLHLMSTVASVVNSYCDPVLA